LWKTPADFHRQAFLFGDCEKTFSNGEGFYLRLQNFLILANFKNEGRRYNGFVFRKIF
jgi:hypothetical protein